MTTDRANNGHPTDLELAAWTDERETGAADLGAHLESCGACRARIAALEATRAALALDPPMPPEAAFAAQRERIFAAIGAEPRADGRVVGRLAWLVPLAAAATAAAILVLGRDEGPRDPRTTGASPGTPQAAVAPLPVLAEAREAAEEAAVTIVPAEDLASEVTIVPSEGFDEDVLDAALAAAEPLAPPISVERSLAVEERFAALSEEDQDAVLLDLASADLGS